MTDQKEPSEEQREFLRNLEQKWGEYIDHHRMAQVLTEWDAWRYRDAAQFRRGVEAAIEVMRRRRVDPAMTVFEGLLNQVLDYAETEMRDLRGDDDE